MSCFQAENKKSNFGMDSWFKVSKKVSAVVLRLFKRSLTVFRIGG